ncbi:MAG: glycerophosphodiester phosphodiesterase [Gemmatimonadales bacterium]|jgi:glycerophosphoryl diester phosphodiesterase
MTLVIAHRGASADEVENSIAAFRLALDQGADGIELDVYVTLDGVPVVHHDPEIGSLPIWRMTADAVTGSTLANGEAVPTLAQALAAIGPESEVFVEVKELPSANDAHLFAALDTAPSPERCRVHSFDHRIVHRLKDQRPELACGILSASYPVHPLRPLQDATAGVLWQQESLIDEGLIRMAHDSGYRVYAWTVDHPDRIRTLVSLGVDAVCTNRPAVARGVIG